MQRSEVWLIDLNPSVGSEMQKTRPAIVVNDDRVGVLPLRVIVPLTDWKDHYRVAPWMVRIDPDTGNGITKVSAADTFQVRSVSQQRFTRRLGKVSDSQMALIANALATVLAIPSTKG